MEVLGITVAIAIPVAWFLLKFKRPRAITALVEVEEVEEAPQNVRLAEDFKPKHMAVDILTAIQAFFPHEDVTFTFYPLASGDKKVTAHFKSGDSIVGIGPTTLDAAIALADKLKVVL